jgi:hypothetical protein
MPVGARLTWSLEEFGAGLDLRDGLFSANQSRFRELTNLWVTKGRKLQRRPPCLRTDGALSANCQGLVSIDGQFYTFAKKGDTVTHTGGVAALVQTLSFDVPDLTTSWTLVAAGTFNGYAAAWIRHTFPSAQYPSLCFLHVWDSLVYAPTFVQDPYLPASFSPSIADLADQIYDATFDPIIGLGASKLWTGTVRGNAQCCRTADARVWNQRTNTAILEDGEHWCYVVPEGSGTVRSYLVPRDASWMAPDGRWAYYVLEYNNGTAWTPMQEVTGAPTLPFTWSWSSVATRFAGGWNEIRLDVCWGRASAGLIRLRLVAGSTSVDVVTSPTVTLTTGSGATWDINVTAATYRWRTNDLQSRAAFVSNVPGTAATYLIGVAGGGFAEVVDITAGFPIGWEREHRRFYKKLVIGAVASGSTALNTPTWDTTTVLTGTATVAIGSPNVTGAGTVFLTQVAAGNVLRINGEDHVVLNVIDDTHLVTTANYAGNAAGATITKVTQHYAQFSGGETSVKTTITTGAVGDNLRINGVDYRIYTVTGGGIYQIRSSAGAAGNYVTAIDALYTATFSAVPTLTDYLYAFQLNESSDWYTARAVEAVDASGAEDALSLATASIDNSGGVITAISSVRQRMLIAYAGSMQLWAIDQDTNRTTYLDTLAFGTGDQPAAPVINWYGSLAMPVATGIRAISVVGANTDNLQDLNIGEPIAALDLDVASAAQFWPLRGQLIFALNHAGSTEVLCLDYSRESKITAWSRWSNPTWAAAGLASIDPGTLIVKGSCLWFRSGVSLYRFDAEATAFADFSDGADLPFESAATFHFNDMGKPGQSKRFLALDIVQDGTCSLGFQLPPYGAWGTDGAGPSENGPTIDGITYGRSRFPIGRTGPAIAPRVTSRDARGWTLQRISIDFLLLRR